VPKTIALSQARWGLAAVVLAALPVAVRSPYARHVVLIALIFAFVALGLNLIFGYAGQHAFGHPVFFGVGAYASALLAVQRGWPVGIAIVVGAIVTAIIAAAVGYPCFRLRGIYFGVATFAFARVIYLVAENWVGLTRGPMGIPSVPPLTVMPSAWTGGVAFEARLHVVLVALLAVTLFLLHRVIDSPIGRAWIAIRENEALATSVGIHPLRYKMAAFAGGGLLAGIGGGLYAHYIGFVSPSELGFHYIGIVFIMLIGGGTGTLLGPVVGALVFGVLPEVLRLAETARNTLLGGILLLSIAFLPEGLVGLWGRVVRRRPGTVDAEPADGERPSPASELVSDGGGIVPSPSSAIGDHTLEVRGVTKRFGGLTVLHEVTFDVRRGEIIGLIGPNGAGKTTLFNIVTGFLEPTAGEVRYGGRRVSGRTPAGVAALGITRTFQITSLFPELTVADNVRTAAHTWAATGLAGVLSRSRRYQAVEEEIGEVVDHVLALTRLSRERQTPARALSYGAQRNLEMAVAIATRGRLLLLDEPAAGLNPEETGRLRDLIIALRARGTTILVIEHDMRLVMEMCDRIVVLNYGEKIAEGAPREIVENPRVVEAYLGTTVAAGHA
jgi:branched-chain amino acid transport system ATP-binding protein/branched-chain amino acid transport system permease protein